MSLSLLHHSPPPLFLLNHPEQKTTHADIPQQYFPIISVASSLFLFSADIVFTSKTSLSRKAQESHDKSSKVGC